MAMAIPAVAQPAPQAVGGALFSGIKTYWTQHENGCQPMVAVTIRNPTGAEVGPIGLRVEVIDTDAKSTFGIGTASVPAAELPPGAAKTIAIGADHQITPHDCIGDMHEVPFSTIHFVVRLSATAGQGASVDLARDVPMQPDLAPGSK